MLDATVFGVVNEDDAHNLKKIVVVLVTNQIGLRMDSVAVLDTSHASIAGVTVSLSGDGKTLTVTGLNQDDEQGLNVWIDLSAAYAQEVIYKMTTSY